MKKLQSYSRCSTWFASVLFGFLAAGCGGQDAVLGVGGTGIPTAVNSPPTVSSTVPLATTPIVSGVAINSKVVVVFSKDMAPASISAASFTLACPAGTPVTGTVAYVASSRAATFSPAANLPGGVTCTATITTGAQDTGGLALVAPFVWTFTTSPTADTTRPTVTLTVPAASSTGVPTNSLITATFSEDMDPATITAATFVATGPGTTPIAGSVSYAVAARTATFTPTTPTTLPATALITATITIGATDLPGNALGGNQAPLPSASNFVWTFSTAGGPDNGTPPTVTLVNPADLATGVCLQKRINATFSESINPATLSTATFLLRVTGPPAGAVLGGTVTYDAPSKVATLTPTAALAANTNYTATVTTGVRDLTGTAMAANRVWSFTTGSQGCPPMAPIPLGAATPFGSMGGGAGITNQGLLTVINGDMGTVGASTVVTGFRDSVGDIYTVTTLNDGLVNGRIYTAPPAPGGAGVGGNATTFAIATQALSDANTAYNNLSPASVPGGTDPGAGQLGGLTLPPGVYQAAGGSFQITGSDLTLDAQGDPNAVWIFQTASTLTIGGPGAPRNVLLVNGALARNVFWRVGSSATVNAAGGGTVVGTIISSAATTFSTAGNVTVVTLNGRALALNASVTMVNTVVNVPAP